MLNVEFQRQLLLEELCDWLTLTWEKLVCTSGYWIVDLLRDVISTIVKHGVSVHADGHGAAKYFEVFDEDEAFEQGLYKKNEQIKIL